MDDVDAVGQDGRIPAADKEIHALSDERLCEHPEILLVRHGHHPDGFRGGWSSHPLTKFGRIQATFLAERLRREGGKINALIASDLPRARETADILGRELDIPVSLNEGWREVDNGVLAGMPNDQADAAYPGLYWSSLHMDQEYPGGESPNKFRSRVEGAFRDVRDRILDGSLGPKVLVVTHGGPIRVVLSLVDGLE